MSRVQSETVRRVAVALVLLAAIAAASTLVLCYSLDSPFADDWPWLDVVSGAQPLSADWLLMPENHHRAPLGKLLYVGLVWMTHDFRCAAVANVVVLAAAALFLLWAVRRPRGETRLSDVAIVLTLLHLGHWYNLIWGHQIFFTISCAVMSGVIGLALISREAEMPLGRGLLIALASCVLAGCGGPGVCFLPAIVLWLAYSGINSLRSAANGQRWAGGALVLMAIVCLALVPLYFSGNRPTEGLSHAPTAALDMQRAYATARGGLQVLSNAAGRMGRDLWPVSGVIVVAIILVAGCLLARAAYRNPAERVRAVGLGCSILAVALLAVGVGWSRGTLDATYCLTARYTTLSCPLVIALYAVFVLYGPTLRSRWFDPVIAVVSLVIGCGYLSTGVHQSQEVRARLARMELLVAEGFSPQAIATRCAGDVQDDPQSLVRHLNQLRDARLGPYRTIPASLPVIDAVTHLLTDHGAAASTQRTSFRTIGDQPWTQPLALVPGERVFRVDIRVRTKLHRAPLPPAFDWTLVERSAAGGATAKASGRCALDELADPLFAPLRFAPFLVEPDSRYELIVSALGKAAGSPPLKLPVLEGAAPLPQAELDGYVYAARGDTPDDLVARPAGDKR